MKSETHLIANSEVLSPLRGDLLGVKEAASSDSVIDADKIWELRFSRIIIPAEK